MERRTTAMRYSIGGIQTINGKEIRVNASAQEFIGPKIKKNSLLFVQINEKAKSYGWFIL